MASFIRLDRPDVAEAAIIVVDSRQGSGLGKAMPRVLAQAACEVGVTRFEASVLYDDAPMLALLDSLGPRESVKRDWSSLVIEVPLPGPGDRRARDRRPARGRLGEFELLTPPMDSRPPARSDHTMKAGIHPDYGLAHVHCSCGNELLHALDQADLHVEICSECHPFYTGKQKLVDTGGRVERFRRRAARSAK